MIQKKTVTSLKKSMKFGLWKVNTHVLKLLRYGIVFSLSSPEDIFSLLLQREGGRERSIDWSPPVHTWTSDF